MKLKNWKILGLVGALLMLAVPSVYAAISSEAITRLNGMNRITYRYGLGTLIQNAETPAADTITSSMIVDGTIVEADLGDSAVTSAKILADTIAAVDIATGGVATAEILDDTIVAADIATGAVATAEILDGTILEADVADYGSDSVVSLKRQLRVSWDPSGSSTLGSSTVDSGSHGLGASLPANALVTRGYMYFVTQPSDAGTVAGAATLALQCEDSANLLAAVDVSGRTPGEVLELIPTGGSALMVKDIAASCEVTAVIATDNYDAGKALIYLDFVIAE